MILNKQALESGMAVNVAGNGTKAMAITALAGVGLLAIKPKFLSNLLGDCHGDHGNNHGNCGHESGVNPNFYCQVSALKDELYYCQSTKYTDMKFNELEEKTERMLIPINHRITELEIQSAINCQRDKDSQYYSAIIAAKNARIEELDDERYVRKQTSTPPGQHLVDCCRPCHPFDANFDVNIWQNGYKNNNTAPQAPNA